MLYLLLEPLASDFRVFNLFRYLTFRTGGAIMTAVGILQSTLGFDETAVGLMIATYVAIDSFGTACNVTGDGAIAAVMDRMLKDKSGRLRDAPAESTV